MKIIAGLGNPGTKYRHTRHNLGFMVLDALCGRLNAKFDRAKHQGVLAEAVYGSERLLLVKPETYMNLSGECLAAVVRNKIQTPADLLVVVDEVHLPLGQLRLRADGSAGGHNGLKSIIERLGTREFPRLRMGVGDTRGSSDLSGYVLSKFRPEEWDTVNDLVARGVDAALLWVSHGAEQAMNTINRGAPDAPREG